MSSYSSGYISIGGKLPRTKLEDFLEALNAARARFDWGDEDDIEEDAFIEWLGLDGPEGPKVLRLMNSTAYYGHFEELETWCTKNGLAWLTSAEADVEYDAVSFCGCVNGVVFRADADINGNMVVAMSAVTSALSSLKAGNIFEAVETLSKVAKELPVVPNFELTDE